MLFDCRLFHNTRKKAGCYRRNQSNRDNDNRQFHFFGIHKILRLLLKSTSYLSFQEGAPAFSCNAQFWQDYPHRQDDEAHGAAF